MCGKDRWIQVRGGGAYVVYGFIEVAHIWMGGTSEMKGGSELENKRMSVEGAAHQWLFT